MSGFTIRKETWMGILLISIIPQVYCQKDPVQEVFEQVLNTLTITKPELPENKAMYLQKTSWEALSYMVEKEGGYTTEDLLEAVPDYYHFLDGTVIVKLINPKDNNSYGLEMELSYKVQAGEILLFDKQNRLKDSWRILYLDANYMALDMGDLRVFFVHTSSQE